MAEIETEIEEVAAVKGNHSAGTIELCDSLGLRTYIPQPKHAHDRVWADKARELQRAVYENRRRMKWAKGKRLGRPRSERVERSFAHVCDSGGMLHSWLRGLVDVTKRYLIAATGHNLGRILRRLFGVGKPKSLQRNVSMTLRNQLGDMVNSRRGGKKSLQQAYRSERRRSHNDLQFDFAMSCSFIGLFAAPSTFGYISG